MKIYKCPTCNGEGQIKITEHGGWLPINASNSTTDRLCSCPTCDGDGWMINKM